MRVIWEVEDGYAGKSRPQYSTIDDEEFEGLSEKEKQELIREIIQHDFEQRITWYVKSQEWD